MSFDIFFQTFRNGECAEFPFALFEREFGPFRESWEPEHVLLKYPDGGLAEIYVTTTNQTVRGFMITHAPATPRFWQSLYTLLMEAPGCLFWAGGGPGGPAVAQPAVRQHLPPGMVEKLGEPIVLTSPEDIVRVIEGDYDKWLNYRDYVVNKNS